MKSKRLGDILISDGLLTQEQLEEALAQQKQTHERLGAVLIEYGYITEKELIDALRNQLGIDFLLQHIGQCLNPSRMAAA